MGIKTKYFPLPEDPEEVLIQRSHNVRTSRLRPKWQHAILVLLLCVAIGASGFFFGERYNDSRSALPRWAQSMRRAPVRYVKQTWRYDPVFGREPQSNNMTEANWDALVPKGQGFVRWPTDTAHPSAVSAVHQLHCLYSIRRAVFQDSSGTSIAGLNMEHMQPPHLRHCFDYLRQALLCAADSTLEPWSEELGGVTGWGVERVCRDYGELKGWVEERRTNDREGFIEVGVKHKKDEE